MTVMRKTKKVLTILSKIWQGTESFSFIAFVKKNYLESK